MLRQHRVEEDAGNSTGSPLGGRKDMSFVRKPVWVQCQGFRTMAYMGQGGKWRNFSDDAEHEDSTVVLGSYDQEV